MMTAIAVLLAIVLVTYVIYPVFVLVATAGKPTATTEDTDGHLPRVFLFTAAHNEVDWIGRKLDSLITGNYSLDRLVCFIGSDASKDGTDVLIQSYSDRLTIHLNRFEERTGKPGIINALVRRAQELYDITENDLFLLTDANILFHHDFLLHLTAAFRDVSIGIADGIVQPLGSSGLIADHEARYMQLESRIKRAEGRLWGCSMGPFGGAYLIRSNLYSDVPDNFLVDDFYIFFQIARKGWKSVVVDRAICYEATPDSLRDEFRRKVRISAGNFQNAAFFSRDILKFWKPYSAVFIIHKLFRWLTPICMLAVIVLLSILAQTNAFARIALVIMISLSVGLPLMDYLFNQLNLKSKWLAGLSYFILMNVALLVGFFQYLKGVRNNVWQPTNRNRKAG